jgi:hypothetical protein
MVGHTWTEKGTYIIRAKAKNVLEAEGAWSEPFNITIFAPEIKINRITGGLFKITTSIKNIGGAEATDVKWSITIYGNSTILLGKRTSGAIPSIPAGAEVNVTSNFIIGFGDILVKVRANIPGSSDTKSRGGKVFLFFIYVNPGGGS